MTFTELAAIAKGRTSGPWKFFPADPGDHGPVVQSDPKGYSVPPDLLIYDDADDDTTQPRLLETDAKFIAAAANVFDELLAIAEAAASVASEPEVADQLSCYNMGVELINRLAAFEAKLAEVK